MDVWKVSVSYFKDLIEAKKQEEFEMSKFKGDQEFFDPKGFTKGVGSEPLNHAERNNTGKTELTLLPPGALEDLAKVLEFGAKKYTRDGWKKGMPYSVCMDSCLRHVFALRKGEWLDKESGLPHAAHAMCNLVFILEYRRAGKKELDDLSDA